MKGRNTKSQNRKTLNTSKDYNGSIFVERTTTIDIEIESASRVHLGNILKALKYYAV